MTNLSPGRLFHLLVVPTGRSRALKLAPVIRSSISATISISESSLPVQRGKSNERSYWVTAIDEEGLTFSIAPHTEASTSYPSSLRTGRPHPCARKAAKKKNNLQFFWDTAVHDKIIYCYCSVRKKALESVLRACFVAILGAAILSPHLGVRREL